MPSCLSRGLLLAAAVAALCTCETAGRSSQQEPPPDLARHVDPFIGTGGHGHTFPGATVPFGMVQLSPDTRLKGWDGCSGYHYTDRRIYGFSHTHLSGTGVSDYGDVLLMPTLRGDTPLRGPDYEQYSQSFQKSREQASPGYYRVRLDDAIDVELTATRRVGMHRYRFPKEHKRHVLLDLVHRDRVIRSSLSFPPSHTELAGERISRAWARDQRVFFVARFSERFDIGTDLHLREPRIDRNDIRVRLHFKASDKPLLVKVGLSATSIEAARKNLDAELPHWDFDRVRQQARASWNRELSKILVEGGTEKQTRIFYTALYHCFIAPNLFSDVDGSYRDLAGKVRASRGHDVYTVFSLWDTFRAAHPLYTLVQQRRTNDFLGTFLSHYEEGGRLPVWELAGNETNCMIGYHAVPVIVDAYVKGIRGHDDSYPDRLYAASRHFAMLDQRGQDAYKAVGFIPSEADGESVSKTLEYGYDDWCIATMAEAMGKDFDRRYFLRRAQAYKHLFDPETGFLRAKQNHTWKTPFDPREVTFDFTEANCWQYTFFVPQDVTGLANLFGGPEAFARKLDDLFQAPQQTTGRRQADITGLIGQYAHGNEPSHHMAYLYNHVAQPWKTQQRVRQILDTLYDDKPNGLCGNEDCGQMSAWYVLSALGFYPVCPGTDRYEIGSPLFEKATLRLENGRRFVIRARNAGQDNPYIQGARLNGRAFARGYVTHGALMAGGGLEFCMGPQPNMAWASAPQDLPRTEISEPVLPVPFVAAPARTFKTTLQIELRSITPDTAIHYTLDGTEPTVRSAAYEKPILLDRTTTVRAFARKSGYPLTPVITAHFHRIPHDWSIHLRSRYSRQYTAGGDIALIDGLRGSNNFRAGGWQGYRGHMDATVDLGRKQKVQKIRAGFLQEIASWIWMPKEVEFLVSNDGKDFRRVARFDAGVSDRDYEKQVKNYEKQLDGVEARYVRVKARNYGRIPAWHLGKGGRAWVFADEIEIETGR